MKRPSPVAVDSARIHPGLVQQIDDVGSARRPEEQKQNLGFSGVGTDVVLPDNRANPDRHWFELKAAGTQPERRAYHTSFIHGHR